MAGWAPVHVLTAAMEYSILKIVFSLITLVTAFVGSLINCYEKYLPSCVLKHYLFGKFAYRGKDATAIEVPKSWFRHFYVFASLCGVTGFALTVLVYFTWGEAPPLVHVVLDLFGSSYRRASVNAASCLLAMTLFMMQCFKRFYETFFVNIFSKTKINLGHYLVGYWHYLGTLLAILVEAPGFTALSAEYKAAVNLRQLSPKDVVSTAVFLWAWWQQLQVARSLADLRKNKKGAVVTLEHKIPTGGLFEYVSSPHMTCEVLMYLCLSTILFTNSTIHYVFFWVVCNQLESSLLNHWWYQNQFKDYPKQRRALIPFVL